MESKKNDYQLRQGDKVYIFSACIIENGVRLSCKNASGKIYSRDFTVLQINEIDPIFNIIKSEKEALEFIDKALNIHKVGVTEDTGMIKIIFYVTTKGIIHTIEIPLRESGKNEFNDNVISLPEKTEGESLPLEFGQQTLESANYEKGETNNYDQQLLYNTYNTNSVVEENTTEFVNNNSNYLSQYETKGANETYNSFNVQGVTELAGTNFENIGSFMFQNDNKYEQANYEIPNYSNDFNGNDSSLVEYFPTQLTQENNYDSKSYEFTDNQNIISTDNNYASAGYENLYQENGASSDINLLNNDQFNYSDTNNQYSQQIIESTNDYKQQSYQEYKATDTLPVITPADPLETNLLTTQMSPNINVTSYESNAFIQSPIGTSQYETHTSPQVNSSLHLPLNQTYGSQYQTSTNVVNDTQYNENIYTTQYLPDNSKDNTDYNKYFEQTTTETIQTNEQYTPAIQATNNVDTLSPQVNYQEQINVNELESQKLKTQTEEANSLKTQTELPSFKKEIEEMAALKSQLLELNSLRAQVAELNSVKTQLDELNNLREQVSQMNILRQQLEEMDALRAKVEDTEILKQKIMELEKSNFEYENEIKELKEALKSSAKKSNFEVDEKGVEEIKHITSEEKPEEICVRGDIIHDTNELEMITRKINKLNKKLTLNLLYKATADSDKAAAFHGKCDDAQSTIVLVETDKGKRFGGYTTCSWRGDCIDKKDEEAFVFSLDKMKTYDNIQGEDAVGCYPKFGPVFLGCQIRIYDNAFIRGGTTFEKGLNFNTEEDYELTGGERIFNVKEIEVYEVIPQ